LKIGRELQKTAQETNQKSSVKSEDVVAMIGLMGAFAMETVVTDLSRMIDKNLRKEVDGYVLALSRIMRRDFAWECIKNVFKSKNEPIPAEYYGHFGQTK